MTLPMTKRGDSGSGFRCAKQQLLIVASIFAIALGATAQTPAPTPPAPQSPPQTDQQPSIKVFTEEVVIPIVAYDARIRFDPTLEMQDILLLEDGVTQELRSLRRIPANVLLLLDTSGELNPAMKTNTTRDVATRLVSQLQAGDSVAAIQFGGRVELVQDWTSDREAAIHSLRSRLFSGKRARLSEAFNSAATLLEKRPMGSRHVVLITDGTDSSGDNESLAQAARKMLGVQATVHIVSFTLLGRKEINRRHPKYLVTVTSEKRKSAQDISDEIVRPNDPNTLDTKLRRKLYLVIEKDFALWRLNRRYVKSLKENELWLTLLAQESGGLILLPETEEEILVQADEVARDIDAQYVVTYKPKRELASATADEYRRIDLVSRRNGLQLRTRRGYLVNRKP